jgi:hypothetical protein
MARNEGDRNGGVMRMSTRAGVKIRTIKQTYTHLIKILTRIVVTPRLNQWSNPTVKQIKNNNKVKKEDLDLYPLDLLPLHPPVLLIDDID